MTRTRETRLFMISPDSMITTDVLARALHTMGDEVRVKETCYGCLAEAEVSLMAEVVRKVRESYGNQVFTKRRAYPAGDPAAAAPSTAPVPDSHSWRPNGSASRSSSTRSTR